MKANSRYDAQDIGDFHYARKDGGVNSLTLTPTIHPTTSHRNVYIISQMYTSLVRPATLETLISPKLVMNSFKI